jgi:hypothetical protein
MCSNCSSGSYRADKIVRPCHGEHRYIWDSKREFRFCESCHEEEPKQEEISPLEQAIADEDFEQILALLDEARRQVIKQAMKRGFAMFSPALTDESVRRPV